MHACKSHEPKANHALRHPFSASDLKSELKSQVLISDRAHQLESVILTLVAVGHKNAGQETKARAAGHIISSPVPSLAGDGEAASAFALANPDPSFGSLRCRLAVHVEKRDRRRQRRAYPKKCFTRLIDHLGDVMAWIPLFRSAKSRIPGMRLSTEVSVTGRIRESGGSQEER